MTEPLGALRHVTYRPNRLNTAHNGDPYLQRELCGACGQVADIEITPAVQTDSFGDEHLICTFRQCLTCSRSRTEPST